MLATKARIQVEETQSHAQQNRVKKNMHRKDMPLADRVAISAAIVISTVAVWLVASAGARIDRLNYSIDSLNTQLQRSAAQNAALTAQVDQLSQPARILAIALDKLHMQYKDPLQVGSVASGQP
jgi:cell division protein FtsL